MKESLEYLVSPSRTPEGLYMLIDNKYRRRLKPSYSIRHTLTVLLNVLETYLGVRLRFSAEFRQNLTNVLEYVKHFYKRFIDA